MAELGEDQLHVRETVLGLADEDLLQMLRSPPEEYTEFALEVARQELARRGGHYAVQQRIAEEASEEWRARATADVASRPWKRILYGALWSLGGVVLVATTRKASGLAGLQMVAWAAIVLGGLQLLRGIIQTFWLRPTGAYIDPSDPVWQDAARQARESMPILRSLAGTYLGQIMVKFPFLTDSGDRELVWGKLRAISDSALRATIETVPIAHAGKLPEEVTTPLSELLDWHLELPDGTIRGSFTTQAEATIRERLGLPLPRRIAALRGRFLDRLQQTSRS